MKTKDSSKNLFKAFKNLRLAELSKEEKQDILGGMSTGVEATLAVLAFAATLAAGAGAGIGVQRLLKGRKLTSDEMIMPAFLGICGIGLTEMFLCSMVGQNRNNQG